VSATDVRGADPGAADPDEPARPPTVRPQWTLQRVSVLLAPAVLYLAIRELSLLILTWLASATGHNVTDALWSWDGRWLLGIAQGGYDGAPDDLVDANGQRLGETPLAFFPGYPTAVRWLAGIDGPGGIGWLTAGFTVTIVFGVACAYGLTRLGELVAGGSRRVGLVLVALFAATPMSIVLSMAYSEAMFCAFAVWALVGVMERRWVLAGACCALAGLVRPTAAALVLAVGLAALIAVIKRRDGWRPWVGGALAPVGLVGYLAWVAVQTGKADGWFGVQQRGWSTGFDGGLATVTYIVRVLNGKGSREAYDFATVVLILVAVGLAVFCALRRLEWPLLVYGLGVLAMDLASDGLMASKVRLMVPAFTLLIPVALALARRRTPMVVSTLGGLAVASSWFGAYAITVWGFAI
jgi:hypothetical protein